MKILVADDDPISRRLLQASLTKWNYEVVLASDGSEAWDILQKESAPKLAVLDSMMPGMDGPRICSEVRKSGSRPYVYIVLLTSNSQKRDIIAGLEAGADDYLLKPFHANELRARLRAGRRILELQEQLLLTCEKLQFRSDHDPLTGLCSRFAIMENMQGELARARRHGTVVGILVVDLDRFKLINDTYGHLAGDSVLREVAGRMRAATRLSDGAGRYGGEEFLFVLPGCDLSSAVGRAEQLRTAISSAPIETPEGLISVTVSIGVTVGGGAVPLVAESLIRAADMALYQAKAAGRNQVRASADTVEQTVDQFVVSLENPGGTSATRWPRDAGGQSISETA